MDVSIRQINKCDWQIFRSVRLKALKTDPNVFGSNFEKESKLTDQEWRDWINADNCCIFMLFDQQRPIGMTGIFTSEKESEKDSAFFWGSWLEPEYRQKGLSERMYKTRIKW
ncbi:MAG: GNAT family N-acetyltransferase, partial [Pyrinomonadaceae bacterium]|nr:GNAT family N-acetyltransferase [Pyrinomonadaceae bacterium]